MDYLALALATLLPLVVLYVLYSLDLYQMGAFRTVLLCFAWGALAYFLAAQINPFVYYQGWVSLENLPRYFAPVAEELLKALVLVYLVRRPKFTYFVDGAIYGFAAGMGFAIFENYEYILGAPGQGLGTALARVISVNLMHASASAVVGAALGLARFRRSLGHLGFLLGGLGLAVLLHGLFNNIVTRMTAGPVLLISTVIGLAAVGFIALAIFRGLAEQKTWIEQTLGMADRVTGQEARAVQRLSEAGEILKPLTKLYGEEKAAQVERFLLLQARLGILRKTLEKLPDERLRQAVGRQMDETRAEMDRARKAVGAYTMASVRLLFPEGGSPVLDLLGQRLQERLEIGPSSGAAGWQQMMGQGLAGEKITPPQPSPNLRFGEGEAPPTPAAAPSPSGEGQDAALLGEVKPSWAQRLQSKTEKKDNHTG